MAPRAVVNEWVDEPPNEWVDETPGEWVDEAPPIIRPAPGPAADPRPSLVDRMAGGLFGAKEAAPALPVQNLPTFPPPERIVRTPAGELYERSLKAYQNGDQAEALALATKARAMEPGLIEAQRMIERINPVRATVRQVSTDTYNAALDAYLGNDQEKALRLAQKALIQDRRNTEALRMVERLTNAAGLTTPAPVAAPPPGPGRDGQIIYPPVSTAGGVVRGLPRLALDTQVEGMKDIGAALAYEGAGAVRGATLGYVDPTSLVEKIPAFRDAPISKGAAEMAGGFAGALAPISGIAKGVQAVTAPIKAFQAVRPWLMALFQAGAAGGIYGAARKPGENETRAMNAANDAATFIAWTGAFQGLGRIMNKTILVPDAKKAAIFEKSKEAGIDAYAKGGTKADARDVFLKTLEDEADAAVKSVKAGTPGTAVQTPDYTEPATEVHIPTAFSRGLSRILARVRRPSLGGVKPGEPFDVGFEPGPEPLGGSSQPGPGPERGAPGSGFIPVAQTPPRPLEVPIAPVRMLRPNFPIPPRFRIPQADIRARAEMIHHDAMQEREAKLSPLEQFIVDNGGIATYKADPVTGKVEEAEEYRDVPVRLRGGTPADIMAQQAADANLLPPGASGDDLREAIKRFQKRGPVPRIQDFYQDARRELENEYEQYGPPSRRPRQNFGTPEPQPFESRGEYNAGQPEKPIEAAGSREALKVGPARAVFRGWQDRAPYDTPVPMYNILGDHKQFGSTVGPSTLKSLGLEIPPTPTFEEWKAGGSRVQEPPAAYGAEGPVWYSQLQKTIEEKMPNAAPVQMVRNLLDPAKGSVKAEEVEWSGINEFLAGKEKVTKAELLEFLRGNQVEVKEVVKSENQEVIEETQRYHDFYERMSQKYGVNFKQHEQFIGSKDSSTFKRLQSEMVAAENQPLKTPLNRPKFSGYQLPGGENYREVLLTLPIQQPENLPDGFSLKENPAKEIAKKHGSQWIVLGPTNLNGVDNRYASGRTQEEALGKFYETHGGHWMVGGKKIFKSPHFDEPNIIAHVRMNDRTTADGKRVLFLEEVQSDWHQKGRDGGYQIENKDARPPLPDAWRIESPNEKHADWRMLAYDNTVQFNAKTEDALWEDADSHLRKVARQKGVVPNAPFKKTWHELALKRMLRYAVDNGYDGIAWTTGEQQAARYDLSKQINFLNYRKNADGTFEISAEIGGRGHPLGKSIRSENLPDIVGKDVAQKILNNGGAPVNFAANSEPKQIWKSLSGVDLKIGGEGMKGFYDQIIPAFLNKYTKKWGGRVGETEISGTSKEANRYEDYKVEQIEAPGPTKYAAFGRLKDDGKWVYVSGKDYPTREGAREEISKLAGAGKITVHALDITPAMRTSVSQGQPLFETRAGYSGGGKLGTSELGTRPAAGGVAPSGALPLDNPILSPSSGKVNENQGRKGVVDTPEFKKWFGASKVVDANGKPLAVYHGTLKDFVAFDVGTQDARDAGFWFGGKREASSYSAFSRPIGQNTKKVFLSIQNPKIYYNRDVKITPELVEDLKKQGYDGVMRDFASGPDAWRYGSNATPEWAAFYPTQIKSAMGNTGAFDPANPSIIAETQMGLFGGAEPGRAVTKKPKPVPEGQGTLFGGQAQPKFNVPKSAFTPEQIAQQTPAVQRLLATPEGRHQVPQDPLPRAIQESVIVQEMEEAGQMATHTMEIKSPEDVAAIFHHMKNNSVEKLYCLALDANNKIIAAQMVGMGVLDSAIANPRDFLKGAHAMGAKKVIPLHNHPSLDPRPSPEDRSLTRLLGEHAERVGMELPYHIVIDDDTFGYISRNGDVEIKPMVKTAPPSGFIPVKSFGQNFFGTGRTLVNTPEKAANLAFTLAGTKKAAVAIALDTKNKAVGVWHLGEKYPDNPKVLGRWLGEMLMRNNAAGIILASENLAESGYISEIRSSVRSWGATLLDMVGWDGQSQGEVQSARGMGRVGESSVGVSEGEAPYFPGYEPPTNPAEEAPKHRMDDTTEEGFYTDEPAPPADLGTGAFARFIGVGKNSNKFPPPEMKAALLNPESKFHDLGFWDEGEGSTLAPIRAVEIMDGKRYGMMKDNFLKPIQDADKTFQWELKEELKGIAEVFKGMSKAEKQNVFDVIEQKGTSTSAKVDTAVAYLKDKYETLLDRLNAVRAKIGKDPIKKRSNYITHFQEMSILQDIIRNFGFRVGNASVTDITDVPASMLAISDFTKANSPYFKFAKQRIGEMTERDAEKAYRIYIEPALRSIHMSRAIKNARDILEWKVVIASEYEGAKPTSTSAFAIRYPNAYNYFSRYLNRLTGKRDKLDKAFPAIAFVAGFTNKLFSAGSIAGNIGTVFTQLASLRNTAAETGPWALKGQTLIMTPKWNRFYQQNSRIAMGRSYEPSYQNERYIGSKVVSGALDKISQTASIPVSMMDNLMVGGAFLSGYFQAKSAGYTEAESIRHGDDVAERTQASANLVDRPPANQGKIKTMMGQFQTFIFNEYSQWKYDFLKQAFKGEKTYQGYGQGLGGMKQGRSRGFERFMYYALGTLALGAIYEALGLPNPFKQEGATIPGGVDNSAASKVWQHVVNQIPYISSVRFGGSPAVKGVLQGMAYILGNEQQKKQALRKLASVGVRAFPLGGQISKTAGAWRLAANEKDTWKAFKLLAFGKYQAQQNAGKPDGKTRTVRTRTVSARGVRARTVRARVAR